jgi:hypothetical protein
MTPDESQMLQATHDAVIKLLESRKPCQAAREANSRALDGFNGKPGMKTRLTVLETSSETLQRSVDRTQAWMRGLIGTMVAGLLAFLALVAQSVFRE